MNVKELANYLSQNVGNWTIEADALNRCFNVRELTAGMMDDDFSGETLYSIDIYDLKTFPKVLSYPFTYSFALERFESAKRSDLWKSQPENLLRFSQRIYLSLAQDYLNDD